MIAQLTGQHLLTLATLDPEAILFLLDLATRLKKKKAQNLRGQCLAGKNIVLLFEKPSTRTRCAFEVAAYDEGACVTFLANSHLGMKESIKDTIKVLSCFYDGVGFRGHDHSTLEILAEQAQVPVWNGLTAKCHPTQALADLLTLQEALKKPLKGCKLVFVGDLVNNVAYSLMIASAKIGLHFVGLGPKALWPQQTVIAPLQALAATQGGSLSFYEQAEMSQALQQADALYTDVWFSMGEKPSSLSDKLMQLIPYQVNQAMVEKTQNNKVIFLHCLPACHDTKTDFGRNLYDQFGLQALEVTDDVFYGSQSVVFQQAENRLHTLKAVMVATIGKMS